MGLLLALLLGAYLLLQNVSTQKAILSEITQGLSKKINSKVESGTIEWSFPNAFIINDLYVEDQQQDTLIYVKRTKVTVNILPLFSREVSLRTVQFTNLRGFIRQDTANRFNFQFVIDAFKKKDSTKSKWKAEIETVGLKDCFVSFHRDSVNTKPGRFNPRYLDVDNLCGHVYLRELSKDSVNVKLHKLSFTEASGLNLSDFSTTITANSSGLKFLHFSTDMPNSHVAFKTAEIKYDNYKSKNFFHDYWLNLDLEKSNVNLFDLRAFVPAFHKLHDNVELSGSVSGAIDNLRISNLFIKNGNGFILDGDLNVSGLPSIKDAFVEADFRNVSVNADYVRRFGSAFINRPVYLPPAFEKMGFVAYEGDVEGSISAITASGTITSNPGVIDLDVVIKNPDSNFSSYSIDGEISTHNFNLADVLPKSQLGKTTLGLTLNLKRNGNADVRKFTIATEGLVDSLDYRGYTYKNIGLNGKFGPEGFTGSFKIDDPNAQFELNGNVNLNKQRPEFRFMANAQHICLAPLNLSSNANNSCVSFDVVADFRGRHFDELEGSISLDNFLYKRSTGKDLMVNNVSLSVTPAQQGRKTASLYSDFVNGKISGEYQLAGLVDNTKKILRNYVPAVISPAVDKQKGNNFTFDFKLNNTEVFSDVFNLPVAMVSEGTLKGYFNDIDRKFSVRLQAPMIRAGKNTLEDVLVLCENPKDEAKLVVRGTVMPLKRRRNPYYFSLNSSAKSDSISSRLNFSNSVDETYSGELNVLTVLNEKTADGLSADFFIRPTELILNDSIWNVHQSKVELRPGMLIVNDFLIDHSDQSLSISGMSNRDVNDKIVCKLHDIRLGYISNMINHERVSFNGITNGNVYVCRLFNKPLLTTSLNVDDAEMNGYPLARNLKATGNFDTRDKAIFFDADLITHVSGAKSIIHGGVYFGGRDSICIGGDLKDIDLRFIRTYVGAVMSEFSGFASGHVTALGHFGKIGLKGNPEARDVKFSIPFLKTTYYVDRDTVYMTPTSFAMRNGHARDGFKGKATVNALVKHEGFQNMEFDVKMKCDNILALNTTEKDNETFYGKALGDGDVHISGYQGLVNIAMKVKSRENTLVTIPIGGSVNVDNADFITFVNDEDRQTANEKRRVRRDKIKKIQTDRNLKSRIVLDMQMTCTPDAQIQLIMDPRAGDIIRARGNGDIHMNYDSQTSEFGMLGTYEVTKGDYLFTVQSIISRKFNILPGSQLHFTGSPYTAGLNVQAKYSLNASLNNILDDPTYSNMSNTSVDCLLFLNGTIQRPIIKFGLELPNADEDVKRKLASVVNTEETLNRNVASLLALGHFYTMDKTNSQSGANGNDELSSVGFSTLSSEIGNLLSRINNDVNVGVNYNPGSEATATAQEFEVALSTQFLNDRLLVNGNFGYRDNSVGSMENQQGTSGILDFDIEYKLTPSGQFRVKGFNRTDNSYFRQSNNGTQGVGLIYREDFDTYREWFNRYLAPFKRKKNK